MGTPNAQLAGGIVGGIGDLIGGQSTQSMYNYKAAVAQMNANIAKQNANYEIETGETQAEQQGLKTRATVGATKVALASGNISTSSGTAAKVVTSEIALGQQSAGIIRANAAKRAYGFQVEAAGDEAQSNIDIMSGQNAKTASYFQAASTILGAAGQSYASAQQGVQTGLYKNTASAYFGG